MRKYSSQIHIKNFIQNSLAYTHKQSTNDNSEGKNLKCESNGERKQKP